MEKGLIAVYPFTFNKIVSKERKIDIRPYMPNLRKLTPGMMIDYRNLESGETVTRELKGIAYFGDFESLINMLDPKMIGYTNREEIRVRVERLYQNGEDTKYGACALFIDDPSVKKMMKVHYAERND
jgi:ASC-1-like (ASCH) protein